MNRFWKYKLDHGIFWVITIGFHMYTRDYLITKAGFDQFLFEVVIRNGLLAVLIYFNWLVLVPKYAQQKKIAVYCFLLCLAMAGYVLLKNIHDVYLYGYVMGDSGKRSILYNTYYNFSIALFYLAFHVALQLSKEWYFQRELIRKMEVEKLTSE